MKSVKSKLPAILFLYSMTLFQAFFPGISFATENFNHLPVKGMVNMIDLGAKKCIPCKMMAPIMERMEKKYKGKAMVVSIDVWERREQAARFRIRAIPTQIFFDKEGKEVYRHVGFMSEEQIVQVMEKLAANP